MSGMRQKVSDIFLSLKHDRKVQVLSVLGLFVLIWFVSELGKPANRVAAKKVTDTTARISDNEAITDLTTALNTKISGIYNC
jgi:hypothetical protein